MKEEWTGLKNAIIRSSRKLTSKEGGAAVKSVKWNDEDEKKSEEDKSTEDGSEEIKLDESLELVEENPSSVEEQMVSDDSLKLIEEELMSDEDPAAISDEEA
jgi:hypothetical protein